jgi:hypothetical protein
MDEELKLRHETIFNFSLGNGYLSFALATALR